MKVSYADYIKKSDVAVLVAEAIFSKLAKKYPKLKVEECAKTMSGGTPLRNNNDYFGGSIPWIKSGELRDGYISRAEEYITERGLSNSSAKLHPTGTLLIAMYGATAGRTAITNIEAATNQAVCAVFPNKIVERDYLFWFFRSHRFRFIEISKGGAQPNISQNVIQQTELPVPPIKIQKEIIGILNNINNKKNYDASSIPSEFLDIVRTVLSSKNNVEAIDTELTHQLDLVKKLRQSFLQEAMQGKLTQQNKEDGNARDLLDRIKVEKAKSAKKEKPLPPIKEEEIPFEIPQNWVWCRLGEICQRIHYGFNASAKPEKRDVRLLRITDIQNNKVDWDSVPGCDYSDSNLENYLLKTNDIVIARTGGTIGKTFLVKEIPVKSLFASYLIRAIPNNNMCGEFLKYFMESPPYWKQLYDAAWGAGQPNVNGTSLSNLFVPFPPLSEQTRIVKKLDELMHLCDEMQSSIKNSQAQNEMLLQQVLREALAG
ncbi:MAG: restriction endonuclease subunit S [Ignavibacteriaceae bacterium]|nr:restriction endonuclease subunit S [Ignavibacteriaceae bacterium]